MVQESEIKRWVSRIVEQFQPEQVILFGSYAQQQQRPDSDVDLLVVMPTIDGPSYKIAAKIRMAIQDLISEVVGIDILVRTPDQIKARTEMGDSFFAKVMTQGRRLHG